MDFVFQHWKRKPPLSNNFETLTFADNKTSNFFKVETNVAAQAISNGTKHFETV